MNEEIEKYISCKKCGDDVPEEGTSNRICEQCREEMSPLS